MSFPRRYVKNAVATNQWDVQWSPDGGATWNYEISFHSEVQAMEYAGNPHPDTGVPLISSPEAINP